MKNEIIYKPLQSNTAGLYDEKTPKISDVYIKK